MIQKPKRNKRIKRNKTTTKREKNVGVILLNR